LTRVTDGFFLPYSSKRRRKTEKEEDEELLKDEIDTNEALTVFTDSPACKCSVGCDRNADDFFFI
jgi:hypothetical protein